MDVILQFLVENALKEQTIISFITMAVVFYINHKLRNHIADSEERTRKINTIADANKIQMRQILYEIHARSQKCRKVSDKDYKAWNEIYSIYVRLGGNSVATGWNDDIKKWRK